MYPTIGTVLAAVKHPCPTILTEIDVPPVFVDRLQPLDLVHRHDPSTGSLHSFPFVLLVTPRQVRSKSRLRSGQIKSGQIKCNQARAGWMKSRHAKSSEKLIKPSQSQKSSKSQVEPAEDRGPPKVLPFLVEVLEGPCCGNPKTC